MIKIEISKNKENKVQSFSVEGHAFAEEHGRDIVCASISILSQTAVLSLYEVGNIDIIYEIDEGWLYCELPENLDDVHRKNADIILNTMLVGIKATQEMYPEYIELIHREV